MNEEHPLHILDNQVDPSERPHVILQKPIRTYEGDVAEAIAKKRPTIATMAIAENQKRATQAVEEKPKSNTGRKIFRVVISLIFIVAGLGGAYYLYLKSPLAPTTVTVKPLKIPSIITPDTQQVLSVGNEREGVLISKLEAEFAKNSSVTGKMHEVILGTSVGSTTLRVTSSQFIERMSLDMPDILKRSLTDRWMLGNYTSENGNAPFIILRTDFFQNAFAGMLAWEKSIPDEFADFFDYRNTSSDFSSFFSIKGKFEDKVIRNRDVREFISEDGRMLLMYSFIDKDSLLITSDEAVLNTIVDRIEKQTYIR